MKCAVAKQNKQRSEIIKRNKESTYSVFHFIWLRFYLKMSRNIYHMSSRSTIPEYQPLGDAFGIEWHNTPGLSCHLGADNLDVTLKAMWYMYNAHFVLSMSVIEKIFFINSTFSLYELHVYGHAPAQEPLTGASLNLLFGRHFLDHH